MIPKFDHNHVTPPHIGDPTDKSQLSPYLSNSFEFTKHFATSPERVEILKGLLKFRKKLNDVGIIEGFQWLDGSFTENIEIVERRSPRDLDIVTLFNPKKLTPEQVKNIEDNFVEFFDFQTSKTNYKLDHYPFNYAMDPLFTVDYTRYWIQLFSHNRLGVWKGIIRLELNTPDLDNEASEYLSNLAL
ncbi:hypothetical protein [Flavobacterium sp.]|uniref:DUF6932 family protein n=1 Tax=Flavobacterium sp. TaxID=239 RepID=UPI0008B8E615|nr:hypothetical protein [Flavobacterium sp.]OGS62280.1 MAG: hypothetical protein A2X07_00085 [Flavobacteria bacterium GWF1_32_7]HBD26831.1 hypothetical protein [Flavobacterium sp.]